MRIAVTDNMGAEAKFRLYINWLMSAGAEVECVKISYAEDNLSEIDSCDGVLITGGGDIEPSLYGAVETHPKVYGTDSKRDAFERNVIDATLRQEKPLLGICRGLQIANVHFGGTLIQDLASIGHPNHTTVQDDEKQHEILLEAKGILSETAGVSSGVINSYHHQAADRIGEGLVVTARSGDGIVEALEFSDSGTKPFFLAVQWHPERMNDNSNPFSKNILQRFLTELYQTTTAK